MRARDLLGVVGIAALVVLTGCGRVERAQPTPSPTPVLTVPIASSSEPKATATATPAVTSTAVVTAAASSSAKPSGIGGPCFRSLVRNADGTPSAEQKCAPGLACDFSGAVPDGPGRCRRR